jgi:predicted nucleotidyltransferase
VRDQLRRALEAEPDVAYALLFGSTSRGRRRRDSDVDVALELRPGARRDARAVGGLVSRLESATGAPIDLLLIDEAPAAVAYRAFRDGQLLVERDHGALVARKARAILAYLDFKPIEDRCAAGVLRRAATGGR